MSTNAAAIQLDSSGVPVEPLKYMTFNASEHPFTDAERYFAGHTIILEHFVPFRLFSPSAQKFTDSPSGYTEVVNAHLDILSLFTAIHFDCHNKVFRGRPVKKNTKQQRKRRSAKTGKKKRNEGEGDNNDDDAEEEDEEEENEPENMDANNLANHVMDNEFDNKESNAVAAFMEVVYTPDDTGAGAKPMGIRTRLSVNMGETDTNLKDWDFGKMLYRILFVNEKLREREMTGKKRRPNMLRHQSITFERYYELVTLYTGEEISSWDKNEQNIMKPESKVYPSNVFTLVRSCANAKINGAAAIYTDPNQYLNAHGSLVCEPGITGEQTKPYFVNAFRYI